MNQLDPTHIMQTATGFWASKAVLTAVEFDLYSGCQPASSRITYPVVTNRP